MDRQINIENIVRYTCCLNHVTDKVAVFGIQKKETELLTEKCSVTMCVALPNKMDKAELIVQKLSEIGIRRIVFRPAARSVLRELAPKKLERLDLIAREAVEQSR